MRQRILVVEDDLAIGGLLTRHLSGPGIEVGLQHDGASGLRSAASGRWNLFIVDRMLPDMDGIRFCRDLRARGTATPVIFLTARDAETDRIEGLDAGADDYLGKPFRIGELKARVRSQLRRALLLGTAATADASELPLEIGSVRLEPGSRCAYRGSESLDLTGREFQLLSFLMRHRDRAWTREQILDRVWGPGYEGYAHTVNSHINRLRAKLEPDPATPRMILTVWGAGYRFGDA